MTEPRTAYLSDLSVTCPKCGRVIGQYQKHGDQVWLRIGIITCRVIRSVCDCGYEFDYDASQKKLEQLIERIKANK